jgi:predicted Rossmann fold nucleotide-binding protein DprA/Smf involved in DNA uptake
MPPAATDAGDQTRAAPRVTDGMGDESRPAADIAACDDAAPAILAALSTEVRHLDEIADHTGIALTQLLPALLRLEINGVIRQHPGARFERRLRSGAVA